ncbi:MAG: ComEC/Rec2 family competence protein [Longispora sp.]|nr:ComEC/Rec2 family competence protein [Longispora sp. (in: high G+C Gram-positive bacteria)]
MSGAGWLGEFTDEPDTSRDLRLAGAAAGAWLATWAALSLALPWVFTGIAAALLCSGVLWRWGRATAAIAVLLGTVAGGLATAQQTMTRDDPAVSALVLQRDSVPVELQITDDPRLVRTGRGYVIAADLHRAQDASMDVHVTVLTSSQEWAGLLPGQRLRTVATFKPPRGGDLRAATLSVRAAPELVGVPPWYQRLSGRLRAGLQHASRTVPEPARGLLPGLVLGDTSRLDPALAEDFRSVGMTHLVAVSGANCAIVLGCVVFLLGIARAGPRTTAILGALALIGFVVLVRPSPSVVRAAAMGMVGLLGLAYGRPRAALPALCAGVFVLLLLDPELSTDLGFALSVSATAGLLLLAPPWREAMMRRGLPRPVAEALAIPAAAQVACGPLIAVVSASVSLTAIPANLLAGPAVAPATLLGVAATAISPVWADVADVLTWLAGWAARWLVLVAGTGADVPGGTLPWLGGVTGGLLLAVATVAILGMTRIRVLRRIVLAVALGVAVGVVPIRVLAPGWPPSGWVFAACDVGQGDALVLPAGDGAAVVVDTGPEPRPVDACLTSLGVRHVPMLVVSHFHADHVEGLLGVFADRTVDSVLVPDFVEPAAGHRLVTTVALRAGARVLVPRSGSVYQVGGVTLEILGPSRKLTGTRSDPNENSLVIRATVGGVRILLTGDAETEEQRELVRGDLGGNLRADILKVPHHGSSFQDDAFLAATNPSIAVISVGARNSYGHPNQALVRRLNVDGVRVLRTDRDGDIVVSGRPGALAVTCRAPST